MVAYQETARFLTRLGIVDVVLPFVLVFTIVFGVLQRSRVLGGRTNVNAMVAFVLGFFTILAVRTMVFVNVFAQYAALVLVAMVFVSVILAFLGVTHKQKNYGVAFYWLVGIALGAVFLFSLGQAGFVDLGTLYNFFVPLLGIAALVGLLWFLFKPEKKPGKARPGVEREKMIRG